MREIHEGIDDEREQWSRDERHEYNAADVMKRIAASPAIDRSPDGSESNPLLEGAYSIDLSAPWPKIPFVIRELGIAAGPPTLLVGFGFSGKTFLASSMVLSVVSGRPLLDRITITQGSALHVDGEQGAIENTARYRMLATGMGLTQDELAGLRCVSLPKFSLDQPDAPSVLRGAVRGHTLCVIDCFRSFTTADENDSRARVGLDRLALVSEETGCAFVVIHHSGKGDRSDKRHAPRGSSALFDAAANVLNLNPKDDDTIVLTQSKVRSGVKMTPLNLKFEPSGDYREEIGRRESLRLVVVSEGSNDEPSIKEKMVRALRGAPGMQLHAADLQKLVGVKKERYLTARDELVAAGALVLLRDSRKHYYKLDEIKAQWAMPEAFDDVDSEPEDVIDQAASSARFPLTVP